MPQSEKDYDDWWFERKFWKRDKVPKKKLKKEDERDLSEGLEVIYESKNVIVMY